MREKVKNKNPEEYYMEMKNAKKTSKGIVAIDKITKDTSKMEKKMLESTSRNNLNLLNMKRTIELKSIERLKKQLHFIGQDKKSKHKIFVKSEKDLEKFQADDYFDTHPSLGSSDLKLKTNDLFNVNLEDNSDYDTLKLYKKLEKHIQNEKILTDAINDLEMNTSLILKDKGIEKLHKDESKVNPNLKEKFKNVVAIQYKNERKK
jgi:hypothetical protein